MVRLPIIGIVVLLMFYAGEGLTVEPAMKVLPMAKFLDANLLGNGNLEEVDDETIRSWYPDEQGYEIARPSLLYLKAVNKEGKIDISVGGKVVMVARGHLV